MLPLPPRKGKAPAIRPFDEPGAIVRREDDQRVFVELEILKRPQDLSDTPIDFLDPIPKSTVGGFSRERLPRMDRRMDRGVRQIEEKRLLLAFAEKPHRFVGVPLDDLALPFLRQKLDDGFIPNQRDHALTSLYGFSLHVVRVRNADVTIKALPGRKKLLADRPDAISRCRRSDSRVF